MEEVTIMYKDKELMLELDAWKAEPMTRYSPPHDAGFDICSAKYKDGTELSPDEINYIDNNLKDDIWDELIKQEELSKETW